MPCGVFTLAIARGWDYPEYSGYRGRERQDAYGCSGSEVARMPRHCRSIGESTFRWLASIGPEILGLGVIEANTLGITL